MNAEFIANTIIGIRTFIAEGFRSLPILLASSILLLGAAQGNVNYLLFFVGFAIITPLVSLCLSYISELGFMKFGLDPKYWSVPNGSMCTFSATSLPDKGSPASVVPTFWYPMVVFFFVYLFMNAYDLYNRPVQPKASSAAVDARKYQTVVAMIIICIMGLATTYVRYASGQGCETGIGMLVGLLTGGGLGYLWYKFIRACGLGRIDDLFGIGNRILPLQTLEEQDPKVCVPT